MPRDSKRIVVVEDNIDVAQTVTRALDSAGFETTHFLRAQDLIRHLAKESPALCIVDLGLPDGDGLELVRTIQADPQVAIMILTGRGDATDRVIGLEVGADDYVVKPFEPRELVARVKAILRRTRQSASGEEPSAQRTARFQGWTFHLDTYSLTSPDDQSLTISAAEAQLLLAFLKAPKRILSREQLLDMTSGQAHETFDRSIDVRISRLRRKIEADSDDPQLIKTVYGAGYLFATTVEWVEDSP